MREADRRPAGGRARPRAPAPSAAGVKHGVVQDKLFLPGLRKLKTGDRQRLLRPHLQRARRVRLLGLRGRPAAGPAPVLELPRRPRAAASSSTCSATGATCWTTCSARSRRCPASAPRISPSARTRTGKPYKADADDAAYATFQLEGGVVAQINSLLGARVRRDDLVDLPGGRHAWQRRRRPAQMLDADRASTRRSRSGTPTSRSRSTSSPAGRKCRTARITRTASTCSGRCSCATSPARRRFPWDLMAGAKGVQLAEAGLRTWRERRWIDLEKLEA